MTLTTRKTLPLRYSNRFSSNPYPLNGLQLYADLFNIEQQGFLLSYDGNDKLAATVANLRSADTGAGTYEITGFKSTSTANNQTLIASCDIGTTTSFFHIYVAATTGRLTISTQDAAGTVNTVSGTVNVCDGVRHPAIQVKSSGTAWSFVVDGVLDTPIVVAGSNTGDWIGDITLRDNVTHGVKTTTGDASWAIAEMGQHRLYSVAISDAECAVNNQRGWKATPLDSTYVVYNLPCQEGTGNPVETVAAVNPTLTGATWVEGLMDRSTNAIPLTSFGSPVWGNTGRIFSSDRITASSVAALNPTNLTLLIWAYNNNSLSGALCEKWAAVGATYPYTIKLDGTNKPLFACYDGTNEPAATWGSSTSGGWHLYSGYRNLATDKVGICVDEATAVEATDTTVGDISNTDVLSIGARGNGGITFTGTIGEVWLYSRVLTILERLQIYNATKDQPRYQS